MMEAHASPYRGIRPNPVRSAMACEYFRISGVKCFPQMLFTVSSESSGSRATATM